MNSKIKIILVLLFSLLTLNCDKDKNNPIQPTNNAPSTPSNPGPADGATNVSRSPVLSWTSSDPDAGDSIKYDLYFGSVNPPNTLSASNWVFPNYSLSTLDTNRTYYWRITARDSKSASAIGPIWSFTTGGASNNLPLELANWKCYVFEHVNVGNITPRYVSPSSGVFEKVSDGLKVYGSGYRNGAMIHYVPTSSYPIVNKTIYMKWKANGGGSFMGTGVWLFSDTLDFVSNASLPAYITNLSTHNSYAGSYQITDDVWYFTRVVVTSTNYMCTTSYNNYDNRGGTVVQNQTGTLDRIYRFPILGLWDTYAGTTAYAILGEIRIE